MAACKAKEQPSAICIQPWPKEQGLASQYLFSKCVCTSVCVYTSLVFKRGLQSKISMHLRGLYFNSGTEGDKMAPFLVGENNTNGEVATQAELGGVAVMPFVHTHTNERGEHLWHLHKHN